MALGHLCAEGHTGPRTNYVHKSVHKIPYMYLIVPPLARLDYIRIFKKKCLKVGKCVELW